jgi:hypothetical protein
MGIRRRTARSPDEIITSGRNGNYISTPTNHKQTDARVTRT